MPSSQPAAGHLAVKPEYLSSQPSAAAKKSEPNRSQSYRPNKSHITDTPITKGQSSYTLRLCCSQLTAAFSQLVQACQLAQRILDRWNPPRWLRHRILDTVTMANDCLGYHLLLRHRTRNYGGLPSTMCVDPSNIPWLHY